MYRFPYVSTIYGADAPHQSSTRSTKESRSIANASSVGRVGTCIYIYRPCSMCCMKNFPSALAVQIRHMYSEGPSFIYPSIMYCIETGIVYVYISRDVTYWVMVFVMNTQYLAE